ncbi:hypothetical protein LCGC14_0867740 [marine sediment metagenome]|uniref:Uncharacterized protein n=1 Tax=marine sediment metagenome TaxID=412755 RepID=A0A0F9PAF4_9ZZZZ
MANRNTIKKMIGNPFSMKGLKDSDGDGVVNMLDCKPYDKNKQGIIHTIGSRVARGVGFKKTAQRIKEEGTASDIRKKKVLQVRRKAREEADIEIAQASEKARAERKIRYIKGGGFVGAFGRGVTETGKGLGAITDTISRPTTRTVTTRRKGKKGKKGKLVTRTVAAQPRKIPNITDFKFNY